MDCSQLNLIACTVIPPSRWGNGPQWLLEKAPGVALVDDFGIKYIRKENVMNLIRILKEYYKVEEDWEGKQYLGITMD